VQSVLSKPFNVIFSITVVFCFFVVVVVLVVVGVDWC